MKKIFAYSVMALMAILLLSSCAKERINNNDNYWLSQERGDVVYSSNGCGYYVVETNYGYTIIRNQDGLRIYDGDVLYGNFGNYGTRDFLNYTTNQVTRGNVVDYDLSYNSALDAIDYYCPYGRTSGATIRQSSNAGNKIQRGAAPGKQ